VGREKSQGPASLKLKAARKFDEFGDIQYSDMMARLDNFAIHLKTNRLQKGYCGVSHPSRPAGLKQQNRLEEQDLD